MQRICKAIIKAVGRFIEEKQSMMLLYTFCFYSDVIISTQNKCKYAVVTDILSSTLKTYKNILFEDVFRKNAICAETL